MHPEDALRSNSLGVTSNMPFAEPRSPIRRVLIRKRYNESHKGSGCAN